MIRIEGLYPMTPRQIKDRLSEPCHRSCNNCNFHKACHRYAGYLARTYIEYLEKKVADAQERIDELETTIQLMKLQMMGDCGVCKHKNVPTVCKECMSIAYHPDWEYEGLPETPKKGES